uniref:Epidermal patterning factor-like protein n=1 Tax=Solanum lycopersicum TaxID=4081 RepID=A0A3Q7JIQ5_SOLLC
MILSNNSIFSLYFSIKSTIIVFFLFLFILFSPSYSLYHHNHKIQDSTKGLLVEEKTRLGSMPPSCYNKCNQCHPCMAAQVPTTPSHRQDGPSPSRGKNIAMEYFDSPSPSTGANRYSNYKPLEWKCKCEDHLYNP